MQKKIYSLLAAGIATFVILTPSADARLTNLGNLQDAKSLQCPGDTCTLEFPQNGGRNAFIQTVSCLIQVTKNASRKPVVSGLQLNQSHAQGVHVFVAPIQLLVSSASQDTYQAYISGLNYHVPTNSKVQVKLDLSGITPPSGMALTCAITGKIDEI